MATCSPAQVGAPPEVYEVLIKAGAKVNQPDKDGATPLLRAAQFNAQIEIYQLLIGLGVD